MRHPAPALLRRRSVLLGGAALSTSACEVTFPPTPHYDGARQYDENVLVAGDQQFCAPGDIKVTDMAWALRCMKVPLAWKYSEDQKRPSRGKDIVIGHVDTGVADHREFDAGGVLWERGYDFIDEVREGRDPLLNTIHIEQIGHGTGTASVIVARGGVTDKRWESTETCGGTTGPGRITGVAPAAFLIPARAFRLAASSDLERLARAVRYLTDQKVDVITMALGWPFPSRDLTAAIKAAIKANILVLAAAGNFVPSVTYPANAGDAIAVAGIGPDKEPWRGSSRGKKVTISAPGDQVWRAYRDEKTTRLDLVGPRFGTSFAVSLTAGVGALWLAHHGREKLIAGLSTKLPTLQETFRAALVRTARQPGTWPAHQGEFGAGIVNAEALLKEPLTV